MIDVEIIEPGDEEAWDAYLLRNPSGLLYSCSKYKRLVAELLRCEPTYLAAREAGEMVGVFPVLRLDGPLGPVYNSLAYYGSYGGPLADSQHAYEALVAAYDELVTADGVVGGTVITNPFPVQDTSGIRREFVDRRVGQLSRIENRTRDELLAAAASSAHRNVRKAERAGVTVSRDATVLDWLCRTHQENMRAIGVPPKTARFFELVARDFEPEREWDVFVGRLDGQPVAAVLVFYFNGVVEYFTPALEHDARPLQPLSLVLIEALAECSRRGFRWWNWGGTGGSETLHRFKRKWGAEDFPYAYYTHLNDRSVLEQTPAELIAGYPGFYVVPFSELVVHAAG